MESDIRSLIEGFVNQIVAAVEADSLGRVQQAVTAAFERQGLSRSVRRALLASAIDFGSPMIRRRPKQLCPVPKCTGLAAPVFGMVCSKHKDMPKAKIAEFRAKRRAAKAGK